MADWENELFWIVVGFLITTCLGMIVAIINWRSQKHKILNDKAWADYELRRDVYLELVAGIGCLFIGGDAASRAQWHETARKVRIVGSDDVVKALNELTTSIREGTSDTDARFYQLNLALRKDIRTLRASPPEGTTLDASAFPIES